MPIIDVTLIEGRTPAEKEKMFVAMTKAAVETLNCRPDQVRIKINEVADTDYAIAGRPMRAIMAEEKG